MPSSGQKKSHEAPQWLEEKVYAARRQRTVDLVKQSIDTLVANGQKVSIASIIKQSKELDPTGHGVSHTGILRNPEAKAYYALHREWNGKSVPQVHRSDPLSAYGHKSVKLGRDQERVMQRYLRLMKNDLAARLIQTEQADAEHREKWLESAENILTFQIQAEEWKKQAEEWKKRAEEWKKRAEKAESELASHYLGKPITPK